MNRFLVFVLILWAAVTGGLAMLVFVQWDVNQELRERNEKLLRTETLAVHACEDISRVNLFYERQLGNMMDQLGLSEALSKHHVPEIKAGIGGPRKDVKSLPGESDGRGPEARGEVR